MPVVAVAPEDPAGLPVAEIVGGDGAGGGVARAPGATVGLGERGWGCTSRRCQNHVWAASRLRNASRSATPMKVCTRGTSSPL